MSDITSLPRKNKQSQFTHFLKTFFLLVFVMVMGVSSAWGQTVPTTSYTLSNVGSNPFALVNLSETQALYVETEQNCKYRLYTESFKDTNAGYTFVLEKPTGSSYGDNDYLLKFRTVSNEDYNVFGYGTAYLNTTSWNTTFVMGQKGSSYTNGRDMNDGAVWTIIDNGNKTYKLQNKATGKYLASNNTGDVAASWSFCALSASYTVSFGPNTDGWGTVTAKRLDTNATITSGTQVPSGTQVQFTATPATDKLTWGWNVNGSDDWSFTNPHTITGDITVKHNFTAGLKFNAYTNDGNLGNIIISGGGREGSSIWVTPWPGDITFTATPKAGCTFDGWFNDVQRTSPASTDDTYKNTTFTLTGVTNQGKDLFAKFSSGYTVTWAPGTIPTGCDAWYTIDDNTTKIKETKIVPSGTKITYHATDTGNDHKMINGWSGMDNTNHFVWAPTYTIN